MAGSRAGWLDPGLAGWTRGVAGWYHGRVGTMVPWVPWVPWYLPRVYHATTPSVPAVRYTPRRPLGGPEHAVSTALRKR